MHAAVDLADGAQPLDALDCPLGDDDGQSVEGDAVAPAEAR
jgi:hypothetical protein